MLYWQRRHKVFVKQLAGFTSHVIVKMQGLELACPANKVYTVIELIIDIYA